MMDAPMRLDIPEILRIIRTNENKILNQIKSRQSALSNVVVAVTRDNMVYFQNTTDALREVEIRCDEAQEHVDNFLLRRTGAQQLEAGLKECLKLLNAEQEIEEDVSAPLDAIEFNVNHVRVRAKVNTLQILAEKAIKHENSSTLTSTLGSLTFELKRMLETSLKIMDMLQKRKNELRNVISKVKDLERRDFCAIGAFHAHLLDMIDGLERSVYDTTVPHLTDLQMQYITIGRPDTTPNPIVPLKTLAERRASTDIIAMRLKRIDNFCNSYLMQDMDNVMNLLWSDTLVGVEQCLDAGETFEIPIVPEGPAEAVEPQAGQPQADEPQAVEPDTVEPETVEPEAVVPQQATETSGSVLN